MAERFIPCPSRPLARFGSGRYLQIARPEDLANETVPDHHYVLRPMALNWELVADRDLPGEVRRYFEAHPNGLCRCPAQLAETLAEAVTEPRLYAHFRRIGPADLVRAS